MTGIVLAGGQSRRMGTDKAWLDWNGRPLLARVADALRAAGCTDVLVVGGDAARVAALGLAHVPDGIAGQGPLQGLAAGLLAAASPLALAVACDMPSLQPQALALLGRLADGFDAAVPWLDPGGWEPLHAAYSVACLPAIQRCLRRGDRKMTAFYEDVRVRRVSAAELSAADPDLRSLRNVNTPEDLAAARRQ